MRDIIYDEGINLEGTDLWFDSKKSVNLNIISNANITDLSQHDRIITTPETAKLIEKKVKESNILICPYNRPFNLGKLRVELIPSGYSLGAAQIIVEVDGTRILYTGDFKLRFSSTSRYIEMRRCDKLIMKCRYGQPKFLFPPDYEIMDKIVEFIKESFYFNYSPIIFVDPLGKAQDLIKFLGERNLVASVHREIFNKIKIYEHFGIEFANCEVFNPKNIKGKVIIFPISMRGAAAIEKIRKKRTCLIMGLAIENENLLKSVFKVDIAFPLSNHAGYDELLQYIEIVKPKEIFLIEGSCIEFSNKLNKMGYNAKPIENPVQLKLF